MCAEKHVTDKDRSSDEVAKLRKEREDVERRIQRQNVELGLLLLDSWNSMINWLLSDVSAS